MTKAAKTTPQTEQQAAPLVEHLKELRFRPMVGIGAVFAGFLVCYAFKETLFMWLTAPLFESYGNQMVFTAPHELFFTYLKLCLLGGFFIGMPVLFDQIWRFVAPGLYQNEKKVVLPFLLATPILFYMGGAFSYFVIMPLAIEFFFGFANDIIMPLPSVREYLAFFIKLTFGFGLAFELPVLLVILAKVGLINAQKLVWFRRYSWLCILIVAALLTPPDPVSQVLLALPMVFLYELSIFLIRSGEKKDTKASKDSKKKAKEREQRMKQRDRERKIKQKEANVSLSVFLSFSSTFFLSLHFLQFRPKPKKKKG